MKNPCELIKTRSLLSKNRIYDNQNKTNKKILKSFKAKIWNTHPFIYILYWPHDLAQIIYKFLRQLSTVLVATLWPTCSELHTAKMYWNAMRSSLTERTPNTQPMPSTGIITNMFHSADLCQTVNVECQILTKTLPHI
jgi:hypothetical protein